MGREQRDLIPRVLTRAGFQLTSWLMVIWELQCGIDREQEYSSADLR